MRAPFSPPPPDERRAQQRLSGGARARRRSPPRAAEAVHEAGADVAARLRALARAQLALLELLLLEDRAVLRHERALELLLLVLALLDELAQLVVLRDEDRVVARARGLAHRLLGEHRFVVEVDLLHL